MDARQRRKGCWVDLFECRDFRGRARRLFGPGEYPHFRGPDGGIVATSLAVGPGAWVVCFRIDAPALSAFWILPGGHVADLEATEMGRKVDALLVCNHEPGPGDPHYESFRRTGHVAG